MARGIELFLLSAAFSNATDLRNCRRCRAYTGDVAIHNCISRGLLRGAHFVIAIELPPYRETGSGIPPAAFIRSGSQSTLYYQLATLGPRSLFQTTAPAAD